MRRFFGNFNRLKLWNSWFDGIPAEYILLALLWYFVFTLILNDDVKVNTVNYPSLPDGEEGASFEYFRHLASV